MQMKILIIIGVACCPLYFFFMMGIYQTFQYVLNQSGTIMVIEYSWLFRLFLNCISYATVLLPGFILCWCLKKIKYFNKPTNHTRLSRTLFMCFGEPTERLPETVVIAEEEKGLATKVCSENYQIFSCITGFILSYLIWGLLQEKIMTKSYTMPDGNQQRFRDSQFLVFINQSTAFLGALVLVVSTQRPLLGTTPIYKYSHGALTYVISTWCQYEALKYVSFPTQVLSKSCQVIPAMLMGKLVAGNRKRFHEYITAALVIGGMVLFVVGTDDDYTSSTVTTMSGVLLLALYVAADGYTSNWQDALFSRYHVTFVQMMCGVSLFSCILTGAALLQQSGSRASFAMLSDPVFRTDCVILSISSTTAQFLTYYTTVQFGAATFTIIMTLRQAILIYGSFMVYEHRVSIVCAIGIITVLGALPLQIHYGQPLPRRRSRTPLPDATPVSPVSLPLLNSRC